MNRPILSDWLAPAFVLCALVLGGSSSGGIWANLVLQWLAAILLLVLIASRAALPVPRALLALGAAAVCLPILQLIPLPPSLWTQLPQRGAVAEGFALAGAALPWMPLSLDPDATLAVLASLLVPAAGLALFAAASPRGVQRALAAVVVVAIGSILLGIMQLLDGEGTVLQPYAITNPGKATGLFANRNHLATLLVMAIPCAVLLAGRDKRWRGGVLAAILTGGPVLTGSRAGIGLAIVAAAVSLAAIHAPARARAPWLALLGAGAALGAAAGLWLAIAPAAPAPGGIEQQRPFIIVTTLEAARDHFPVGSGGGSFLRVYQHHEDPAVTTPEYRNHAHNDYAEVLLEYGAPGAALVLAAIGWWAVAAFAAWRGGPGCAGARAGVIMLGVVLAHSLVDYPLRTAALALLAAAAGIIAARRDEAAQAPAAGQSEAPQDDPRHLRITL
ncbi:MAG: O-antigen ligase family protein [Erythrobacter sp.]|uniref:O-antigen ligase family protein n=1 Tax=Erythrobacter sp. TaxID=1042 RepID=UPI0025CE5366|nr:O-antigen ligase family protein [Erythrobacter sp.]MCL9999644.1 O-antigen ligase family protein [Erythrobacter sp.]